LYGKYNRPCRHHADFGPAFKLGLVALFEHDSGHARSRSDYRADCCSLNAAYRAAYRRAANIVRIEEKKDKRAYDGAVAAAALQQAEEKTLFSHLGDASKGAQNALGSEDFTAAMAAMAQLRQPVDAFFDQVTVNAEDAALRENRLQLLSAIGATLAEVADFSKIEG